MSEKATFNIRDRELIVRTDVKVDNLQSELNAHKQDNIRSFDKGDKRFEQVRIEISKLSRIIYLMVGALMVLQVALKFIH